MDNRQTAAQVCAWAAYLCACIGCALTGYSYASMQCAIAHGGASAPAWVALLTAIPWAGLVLLFVIANCLLKKKK